MMDDMLELLHKIEMGGYKAYIVGGYPRDRYMGTVSTDIDICTSATPDELKELLTDIEEVSYGSVRYQNYEITTFRKEASYLKNRFPESIVFTKDLKEDLLRRDFIMNTLCIDAKGVELDYLGAKKDIDNQIIRTVGSAMLKVNEDVLRILRAIRFATVLDFKLDDELILAIINQKYLLKNLSNYRKREELEVILKSNNRKKGIDFITTYDLEVELGISGFQTIVPTTEVIGLWAQLTVEDKNIFSKEEQKKIGNIKECLKQDILGMMEYYKYDTDILEIVSQIKGLDKDKVLLIKNSLIIQSRGDINITGLEIKQLLHLKEDKKISVILAELEKALLRREVENDKLKIKIYLLDKYKSEKHTL